MDKNKSSSEVTPSTPQEPATASQATVISSEPVTAIRPDLNVATPPLPAIESPEPLPAPQATNMPVSASAQTPTNNAGVLILQWLTYAFWGWAVLSLSILTYLVISNLLKGSDNGNSIQFAIAAVVVLLPISVVCDFFYSKQEPSKKTGVALAIMVIHAVIFALFGIGSLIAAVFAVVNLGTTSGDTTPSFSSLYSFIIIAIIYGMTFVRTLNPIEGKLIKRSYTIAMVAIVGIITVLGFIGPVASARLTRDDKLIENNLSSLQGGISNYVQTNSTLPTTLDQVQLVGDPKQLVSRNLVVYTPNTKIETVKLDGAGNTRKLINQPSYQNRKALYYTLCVTYKKDNHTQNSYPVRESATVDGYSEYISAYSHPAGNVCYKLIAGNSYGEPVPLEATPK